MITNILATYSMMEVQWFGQLEFKVKLHPNDFIIKNIFSKVKAENLPSSNECINVGNRDSSFLSFIDYLPFYQSVRTVMEEA